VTVGDTKGAIKGQKGQIIAKQIEHKYSCEFCQKSYESRNGLWKHQKKCKIEDNSSAEETDINTTELSEKDLIMMIVKQNTELIKENNEFKSMMMEVIKNGTTQNSNNNITTNSHNKAFNLNFFLNETCKDAMNITDFVESIKLQLSDLEKVGELGYVEGISNIIVKNLKELDVTQRPVHCTDKKRETMYIKDEDTWEKDEERKKMHKLVRKVADKNARMLPKFKEAHPDCLKSSSRYSDQYNKIIMEAMGGRGDDDFEKEEKIIKRVSKEVIVDKDSV
jgi:ribosomal protein L37AE/L43A